MQPLVAIRSCRPGPTCAWVDATASTVDAIGPTRLPVSALPLQGDGIGPAAVAGTVGLLALFLSITAHIAARNVLGDVAVVKAFGVGPVPALVSFLTQLLGLTPGVGVAFALVLDGVAIHYVYGQTRRLSAYITLIHAIVSVILGTILFGVLTLAMTAPG